MLQKERSDFDGFLRFWRHFLTPQGLMYWQLLRGNDGKVTGYNSTTPCCGLSVCQIMLVSLIMSAVTPTSQTYLVMTWTVVNRLRQTKGR